ncbi:MAG: hypothetical protein ACXWCC_18500, partial [Caldimonas sp.]
IISVAVESMQVDVDTALRTETAYLAELAAGQRPPATSRRWRDACAKNRKSAPALLFGNAHSRQRRSCCTATPPRS